MNDKLREESCQYRSYIKSILYQLLICDVLNPNTLKTIGYI